MNNLIKRYEFIILDEPNQDLKDKFHKFRRNVIKNNGLMRTDEQWEIHIDKYCSLKDVRKWILVLYKDTIIGSTLVFGRNITYANESIFLGGIGEVAVSKDYRKQKIGNKMMNLAMKEAKKIKFDFMILNTETKTFLSDFYAKFGFSILDKKYQYLGKSGKKYIGDGLMVANGNSNQKLNIFKNSDQILELGMGDW